MMKNMQSEKNTVKKMITLYCSEQHQRQLHQQGLCAECTALFTYAEKKLDDCKFGKEKPTCGKCTVHCYKPEMRAKITKVMRYAGPKMIFHHPLDAINHLIHSKRSTGTKKH